MIRPRILIACIGNIFLGDDGFGVETAKRLMMRPMNENVRVEDYGIRSFDLAYALMDGYDATILVDAAPRGEAPGTLYVIELDPHEIDDSESQSISVDAHSMNPMIVLQMARSFGANFSRLLLVGCEPETFGGEEGLMGLSAPVEAAVNDAVPLIESLVEKILSESLDGATALTTN